MKETAPDLIDSRVGQTPWSAAGPLASLLQLRILPRAKHYKFAPSHRRYLPHLYETGRPIFLTWRLHGSLPLNRSFPNTDGTAGQLFVAMDRLLHRAESGPVYLNQPEIADMVVEAIHYNTTELKHYDLHAFVIMPNHVHLLITPRVDLPKLTRSLKGITAKRANQLRALTGMRFWQDESFDRLVRDEREFVKIRDYIEGNPVRTGLLKDSADYRWTSRLTRGSSPLFEECPEFGVGRERD